MGEKFFIDDVSDILRIRHNRREFISKLCLGAAGAAFSSLTSSGLSAVVSGNTGESTVSLVTGTDRRDMVFQALKPLEEEVKQGIADKQG